MTLEILFSLSLSVTLFLIIPSFPFIVGDIIPYKHSQLAVNPALYSPYSLLSF